MYVAPIFQGLISVHYSHLYSRRYVQYLKFGDREQNKIPILSIVNRIADSYRPYFIFWRSFVEVMNCIPILVERNLQCSGSISNCWERRWLGEWGSQHSVSISNCWDRRWLGEWRYQHSVSISNCWERRWLGERDSQHSVSVINSQTEDD
jgi:hypothetical protein